MSLRAPKGVEDVLPPASRRWRRLVAVWDDWSGRYGYEPIMIPLFERTEVFSRGVGEETEVVEKQMYTFTDKGGRSLTLRPEGTAPVVRAFLEAGGPGTLGRWKVAYSGPMFRYEQPQAGRSRQFFQVGVEYLGEEAPGADAEVIELGYRYLEAAGVPAVAVLLNSIGDPECRPRYLEALRAHLGERDDLLCPDCRRRRERSPMRVLDCKRCGPRLSDAPAPVDHLCPACRAHYAGVKELLETLEVPYREAPRLVRGLDYYTRTAFEYVAEDLEIAQDAVGGGGRYDGLAEVLGGPPTPGVGLALGVDRIVLAVEQAGVEQEPSPLDLFVVVAAEDRRREAVGLTSSLRRRDGLRVDLDPGRRSVRAQFRAADRAGARVVVVVGEEWSDGKVTVRDMASGEQQLLTIEEVGSWARSR